MSKHLYYLAFTVPWQITPDALEAMVAIAADEPLETDELKRRMHGPKALAMRDGSRRDDSGRMTMRDGVALIPIDGPIYRYADMFTEVSGGVTTEALAKDFQKALDDPSVKAILFVIDSPGGEATGINEFADTIYAARAVKPSAAYVEGYGASAAYRIAAATSEIIIDADAWIGSIGTVFGVPDPTKRISRTIDFVSSQSPKKRADPTTESGRAYYQQLADDMTETFIAKVMRDRGITRDQVLAAEGGILVGQAAIGAGLADRIGSEEQAIQDLLGAVATQTGVLTRARQEDSMKLNVSDIFGGFFKAAKEQGIEIEGETAPDSVLRTAAAHQPPTQPAQADSDQVRELRAQLIKMQAEHITTAAASFVTQQITAGHAYPAESAQLTALYIRAAQSDASAPPADGQPTSVALLTAALEARPANRLASNLLPATLPAGSVVLPNQASSEQAELAQIDAETRDFAKRQNKGGRVKTA